MRALRRAIARLTGLFAGRRREAELRAELEAHLAHLTDEHLAAGLPPAEARRAALLAFGGPAAIAEQYRDQRSIPLLENLMQDLRYALRTLRREPAFAATAVVILALGLGANAAIFTLLQSFLLRPLPVASSDRLFWVENVWPGSKESGLSGITSRAEVYEEWQRRTTRTTEQLEGFNAFFGRGSVALTGGEGEPERLAAVGVTRGFLPLLGVAPLLGHGFTAEETKPKASPVALMSHSLWQRRFGGDPSLVGRTISIDDITVTVTGILPASFDFGDLFAPGTAVDLIVPLPLEDARHWGHTMAVIGRMRPGISLADVQADFHAANEAFFETRPRDRAYTGAHLSMLQDHISGSLRRPLYLLAGAVTAVLLIVCVNLGNLLLVRGAGRRRELAVRAALGASRGRLIRQSLTETLLLSAAGAALGLGLAAVLIRFASTLSNVGLPLLHGVRLDASVVGFTLALTLLTALLCGWLPALGASGGDPQEALREGARGMSGGRAAARVRAGLVVTEIALACLLVAGAGLMIRSFLHVMEVDLGFRPGHAMALRLDSTRDRTDAQMIAFWDHLLTQVRAVPGVGQAALTDALPLDRNRSWGITAKGVLYPEGHGPSVFVRMVTPAYFGAMGVPLRRGRDFHAHDGDKSQPVVILNETAARTLWPGAEALGQLAHIGGKDRLVVGVAGDVRHSGPEEQAGLEAYMPVAQMRASSVDLIVRSAQDPLRLAPALRAVIRPLDPALPLTEFRPLQLLVDRAVSPRRLLVWLLGAFAGLAVLLASLGIYGVVAYTVNQRTSEIGIRMALGASAGQVQRSVLWRTLALALAGVGVGVAASLALATSVQSLLYGVEPRDPFSFLAAPFLLGAVAMLAAWLPARRAARIDPLQALRAE